MSIDLVSHAEYASGNAYVVVPPCASDVLARSLRDAYRTPASDNNPFADLLRDLDMLDLPPSLI